MIFFTYSSLTSGRAIATAAKLIFVHSAGESTYGMIFIDQHYCFDGDRWAFPDLPHMETYYPNSVCVGVTGWNSFEPTFSQIETIEYADLCQCPVKFRMNGMSTTAKDYSSWWKYSTNTGCWFATMSTKASRIEKRFHLEDC